MKKSIIISIVILYMCHPLSLISQTQGITFQSEVQQFLTEYNRRFQELSILSNEADWNVNTKIIEGDSTNAKASQKAKEELAKFTGSKGNIEKARKYLEQKEKLPELQVKQLNKILYMAANNPETLQGLVKDRIKAETAQVEKLFGYDFKIDGKSVTTNEIGDILNKENDIEKRKKAWEASKEVGRNLKDGLADLQRLRNETVKELGYTDFFNYQVSDYGMGTDEMMALNKKFIREIWPLYRELHTYARYELAKKYNQKEIPEYLPAHWMSNRWAQDWSAMIEVKGLNLDSIIASKGPEWTVTQGEGFYKSIGFGALPKSFYEKSSLYPVPPGANYKKNNHASAWHLDLDKDVRSLMSVEANSDWYETVNHELGHIYYFLEYSNKDVPIVLREGANRAYHEALGSMIGFAAMQKGFLSQNKLLPPNAKSDEMQELLKQAMQFVVFIPWSAGVMTEFEYELYAKNLPKEQYNSRWWELVKKYQGVTPPSQRGEEYCDAASKTHINDDAAQYYDYAISYILLFQVHNYIAKQILHQDPHNTNYYGNKKVGEFLKSIMYWGASKDWRKVLKETTGEDLSAQAMLNYFEPLTKYLQKTNKGRKYSLPLTIE